MPMALTEPDMEPEPEETPRIASDRIPSLRRRVVSQSVRHLPYHQEARTMLSCDSRECRTEHLCRGVLQGVRASGTERARGRTCPLAQIHGAARRLRHSMHARLVSRKEHSYSYAALHRRWGCQGAMRTLREAERDGDSAWHIGPAGSRGVHAACISTLPEILTSPSCTVRCVRGTPRFPNYEVRFSNSDRSLPSQIRFTKANGSWCDNRVPFRGLEHGRSGLVSEGCVSHHASGCLEGCLEADAAAGEGSRVGTSCRLFTLPALTACLPFPPLPLCLHRLRGHMRA